jgi:hypothetical protein
MLIVRPPTDEEEEAFARRRRGLPNVYGHGGYAVPRQPIRVLLARDEEAAGIESITNVAKPPAYGLWRESVVRSHAISCSYKSLDLTPGLSASTPTAYTGNAMMKHKRRQSRRRTRMRVVREQVARIMARGLGRREDHLRMPRTTASRISWRRNPVRLRRRRMCLLRRTLLRLDEWPSRMSGDSCGICKWIC